MDDLVEIRVRAALLLPGGASAASPLRVSEPHERVTPGIKLMATSRASYDRAVTDDADITAAITRNREPKPALWTLWAPTFPANSA
jgi:hypothetical protein